MGCYGDICDSSCRHCVYEETGDIYYGTCYHGCVPNYQQPKCKSKRNENNFTIFSLCNQCFFLTTKVIHSIFQYVKTGSTMLPVLSNAVTVSEENCVKNMMVLASMAAVKFRTPFLSWYAVNESKDPLILLYVQTNEYHLKFYFQYVNVNILTLLHHVYIVLLYRIKL